MSTHSVVSLFPSASEVAAELGVVPAAVSHQCDHPPAVRDRPTLTGLVRDLDADPANADRIVAFDDVYYLDGDVLADADPDVVLTQGVCAVCALDAGLAHEAVERLDLDATVLDVHAETLEDVLENIDRVGEAIGRSGAATALRADLESRIERVKTADGAPPSNSRRPRVAVLDWTDPIRHGGLWVPELIEAAGGECGLAEPGSRAGKVSSAELRSFDPEVLVVAPCGYDLAESTAATEELLVREAFETVAAVQAGRVYAMDGAAHFNRHSHRVVDALETLAEVIRSPDASVAVEKHVSEGIADSSVEKRVRRVTVPGVEG
ncbi:ABC transporter substrate-binding protein [Halorubrum vacuolatum]|uniref:Iron complex transport system substrate-binding protein n=1 Tax=Halorubrum vacuolatum TaxID=63740 RepID=A0A238VA50_HALVU|nr:ABC transporter substrate-binding protein [Halorubrum vacuolatum]SNR31275.1 iron complex transport system substrate-binding protein [Halorubrum vacuolatum]